MFETTQGNVDVGIVTRDIGKMKDFYVNILGFEDIAVRDIPADFVQKAGFGGGGFKLHALRFGNTLVKLLEMNEMPPAGNTRVDAQAGFRYLTFWVRDMEAAIDHLRKARVEILSDIQSRVPGRKMVFFKDPDGNLLELNWLDPAIATK
jgi:catechol 2,3-dioxygenase-like lactoylglutathione lyase family enzyme